MNFWLMRMFLSRTSGGIMRGERPFSMETFKTAVFSLLNSSWSTQQKLLDESVDSGAGGSTFCQFFLHL